jgi:hypothetical protein
VTEAGEQKMMAMQTKKSRQQRPFQSSLFSFSFFYGFLQTTTKTLPRNQTKPKKRVAREEGGN